MSLSSPAAVQAALHGIDGDLAHRQNELEAAALGHYRAKRDREKKWAEAFMAAEGSVEARRAQATIATAHLGVEEEGRYESLRGVVRVLDTRAAIGMAILKAQGRA